MKENTKYIFTRSLVCMKAKRDRLSSHKGFFYAFLFILLINLAGISFVLLSSENKDIPSNRANISKKISTPYNVFDEELEIFQKVMASSNLKPEVAMDIASVIHSKSNEYGIEPLLVLSVIQTESNFRTSVSSHKGARGIMQIMPLTGRYIAKKYGIPFKNHKQLYNPVTNIELGIAYLSYLNNRYENNLEYALFAYNHGPKSRSYIKKKFMNSKPHYVEKVIKSKQFFENP